MNYTFLDITDIVNSEKSLTYSKLNVSYIFKLLKTRDLKL